MRHRSKHRTLGRNMAHRKSMFCNLATSLIVHEKIKTTLARAKDLRGVVEPLVTIAKKDNLTNRKTAYAVLKNRTAVSKLFKEISPRHASRPGGYTRITRIAPRLGDNAQMAVIEFLK
ncbi:MAG TPA: 50S ribosomal protein L17 [Oligoflexia bacterium]|nr:50S ribosomal protein L17 [Oligoflexia bacterium]HMP26472.1 50S ribosomal protein L17 [Oligoflexia bacterium]